MTTTGATSEIFWTAFNALSKKERNAVVDRFLKDQDFMEALIDLVILEQRKDESSKPLGEYLSDRKAAN